MSAQLGNMCFQINVGLIRKHASLLLTVDKETVTVVNGSVIITI